MVESSAKMLTIWLGTRAVDAISLETILPIDLIIGCDYGSDVIEIEKSKPIFSIEKKEGVRHSWNNFHLNYFFDDNATLFLMQQLEKYKPERIQFLCYSSSILLEKLIYTLKLPANNISISSGLKNKFDDKIMLNQWQKWLRLPVIPSSIELLGSLDYSTTKEKYGNNVVIKLPIGSAGGKVYFVESKDGFDNIQSRHPSSSVLIQKYIPGIPINLQGVITKDSVFWAPPSIQVIGSAECTLNKFEWCGNDFHTIQYLSQENLSAVITSANVIVTELRRHGYLGIIGLDFLLDTVSHIPYLLEINPRFQGSTALLSQLEFINNLYPLVARHIKVFNGYCPSPKTSSNERMYLDTNGSQVILHNKNSVPVKVVSSLSFGVYFFDYKNKRVVYKRKGYTLRDCMSKEEFVISGGVPVSNQVIMPGSPMLWVQFFDDILNDPTTGQLNSHIKEICEKISEMIVVSPLEKNEQNQEYKND